MNEWLCTQRHEWVKQLMKSEGMGRTASPSSSCSTVLSCDSLPRGTAVEPHLLDLGHNQRPVHHAELWVARRWAPCPAELAWWARTASGQQQLLPGRLPPAGPGRPGWQRVHMPGHSPTQGPWPPLPAPARWVRARGLVLGRWGRAALWNQGEGLWVLAAEQKCKVSQDPVLPPCPGTQFLMHKIRGLGLGLCCPIKMWCEP